MFSDLIARILGTEKVIDLLEKVLYWLERRIHPEPVARTNARDYANLVRRRHGIMEVPL